MKKVSLVVSEYLKNNSIFDESGLHRDDIFDRFIKLKKEFKKHGYDLSTQDINPISESELIIYGSNMPDILPTKDDVDKSYLILSESHFIKPENYDQKKHDFFNKIFTWADDLVDNKKYFKLNYAHLFPDEIKIGTKHKKNLCTLISANKSAPHTVEGDLYEERKNAIRWFEKYHPSEFDLYGVNWDKYRFSGPLVIRAFNRFPLFCSFYQKITRNTFPSYKGMVSSKNLVMENYKFSICYENAKDIPGYITEKLFDSFFAGCVPIYLGANNVTDHIPANCFVDKREFHSYEDLYQFMNEMSDETYIGYLNNIQDFLINAESRPFKSEGFVETIVKNVLGINYDYK